MGKKDILNSKLTKSMEMEDTTKEKRTLGKRKNPEEAESEDESEDVSSDSESEDESEDISSDSESEPDSERTISQDDNIGRKQKRTRIAVQPPQNVEANAAVRNERRSKMRHEVNDEAVQPPPSADLNAAAIEPPHNSEVNAAVGNERRSKHRHEVNVEAILPPPNAEVNLAGTEIIADAEAAPLNPLPENPAAAAPIETLPPNAAPAVAQINQLDENANAAVDPPPQGVATIDDMLVTPQDCEIEVVEATSAEEELISRELSESTTHLVVETNVEKGDIAEKESVIEVVEATSAEEELIRRELSESIANLVVETNVENGDIAEKESVIEQLTHKYWESNREPKENVETNKEVHKEINRNIMMIAKMAVAQGDMGPLPSFDLGIDFGSQSQSQSQPDKEKEPAQETEKHDQDVQKQKGKEIQQHQGPEIKTPRFKTGKQYEAMRYHFTSMAEEAEMDLAIVQIMCILYNRENNEKFKHTTYCVPPLFSHNILEKYGPDYIDTKTGLPYKIETMSNLDALDYIDENKIKSSPFLFASILYSHHWWLYVLDVTNKKFYVLDLKNSEPRRGDRNKLNRFASNVLDQMRVRAGVETVFSRMTKNMVTHSLFPKYIRVPKQPNA
ncbi:hypothetical protein PIB30_035955 [Stylosanthes scabra]|uniref:Ubiquitin-like protease family profile domain-containing protein n=1 Tax=Stylosanthes scabra TaxID=79078 RepID=A0ABU6QDE1_9FABA|nr:hypothetical protein [Stylosanthes scabra]